MKILFLSHYFPPEVNAPASRTYDHCVRWAKENDVTVLTCNPNCPDGILFPGYRNRLISQTETIDLIKVVRVWTYLAPNAGTTRRILNYLSYCLFAVIRGVWIKRPDVVVATSPQFFCAWAGLLIARLRWVPFVLEIRDIWPESIETVGAMRKGAIIRILKIMERLLYRWADHIVTVGDGYRERIVSKANVADRTSVIMNGVDLNLFRPKARDELLIKSLGLEGKFVCSYVGTIGMAHGLEVVVEAAKLLKQENRRDIAFLLVGEGADKKHLELLVDESNLREWVKFAGLQPKEEIPRFLASSDICLIHLRKSELFQSVVPSKIFETMAMQRPILMGVAGQAASIVEQSGAALPVTPGSPRDLADTLKRLAGSPETIKSLGISARRFVSENFNRDTLAAEYLQLLHILAQPCRECVRT